MQKQYVQPFHYEVPYSSDKRLVLKLGEVLQRHDIFFYLQC